MVSVGMTSYDSSGQGGPFRSSCTADSISCSHGSPLLAALSALVIAGVFVRIAFAGQAVGKHPTRWVGRLTMGAIVVGVTVVLAIVFWVVTVRP